MHFIDTIQTAIECGNLIPDSADVVVGVSGGADSVALAWAFQQLNIPFTLAHLNHHLRGEESAGDEQFVCSLAEELGRPVVVQHADVGTLAAASDLSIEMAARQARHAFFSEFENAVIALAHHADDQVETFFLKLGRGAGAEGLGGMPAFQQLGTLRIIRPMLGIRRADVLNWLEASGFVWREDASNLDEAYQRNRVRHTILPMLETELNPNLRETILRTMDILRAENAFVDDAASRVLQQEPKLEASIILKHPVALQRRIVRKWLFDQGLLEVGLETVDALLDMIREKTGSVTYELNRHQRVIVEYGVPRFEEGPLQNEPPAFCLTIEAGTGWKKDHGRGPGVLPAEASFNADKVGASPIEVRTWHSGDRMNPQGMDGSRKLQDIFTDAKVAKACRSDIPVVTCRDEIIWLPGYRTARDWAVEGEQGAALHVTLDRENPK